MCWLLLTLYDSVIHPTDVYQLPIGRSCIVNVPVYCFPAPNPVSPHIKAMHRVHALRGLIQP